MEQHKNEEECWTCRVFADFTLAIALQMRKKHGKASVSVISYTKLTCVLILFLSLQTVYFYILYLIIQNL